MLNRNIPILSLSQALGMSGPPMMILLGGIIGTDLAPTPALATLPISLMVVGVALFAIPAALFMRKYGRRAGFSGSSLLAAGAALLAALAVAQASFLLFCLAAALLGANMAFVQQYRFAAAESVPPHQAGRAVSLVLVGGIVAGYLGPQIAAWTKDMLPWGAYTGSFIVLASLYLLVALLLLLIQDSLPQESDARGRERPLRAIIFQPIYLAALLSGAVAYGVMSFIMTATPLHLHHTHHYSLDQTAWVIQSHVIAMYLPSLFTGFLLDRLGVVRVMAAGAMGMMGCVFLAIAGYDLMHFWGALVLLGLGWNLLFVGSTVLLTYSYHTSERFKAQAANDFTIFGVQAFTSLSSGAVLYFASWEALQLATLPFLLLILAMIFQLRQRIWAAVSAN